jgi:hypothetical protein
MNVTFTQSVFAAGAGGKGARAQNQSNPSNVAYGGAGYGGGGGGAAWIKGGKCGGWAYQGGAGGGGGLLINGYGTNGQNTLSNNQQGPGGDGVVYVEWEPVGKTSVNAQCGSASGSCRIGTAGAVSNSTDSSGSTYSSWPCVGFNGGAVDSCSICSPATDSYGIIYNVTTDHCDDWYTDSCGNQFSVHNNSSDCT